MKEETRRRAAEMVLEEYLVEGKTEEAEAAVKEAGRNLAAEEVRQLFNNALSQRKSWEAIKAAKLISLTEEDKDKLLSACWTSYHIFPALEVTKRELSEKDFHRLVKRATDNWGVQSVIVELVKKTGYQLTDQEKKGFLNLMVKEQRRCSGYDIHRLREGLEFLGDWLPSEGAERLFTILESYRFPDIAFESMMQLAILAKGKVNKDRILNKAALSIGRWWLGKFEETVQQTTGESLTLGDYHYLFCAAEN